MHFQFPTTFKVDSWILLKVFWVSTPTDNIIFCFFPPPHTGADVETIDHPRLALGSHIAAELRDAIHSKLGLTGCAGIATNKLLAKLVSGTFKPNQQTTLLPENVSDIMGCLSGLRKIPGIDVEHRF